MASLSQPVGVHNLTAWFIFAPPAAARHPRDYAVLEETIAAETAVLHETGSVNELLIENKGDLDLFIQAGDIVKGGRQDRTIGADFIVPAWPRWTAVSWAWCGRSTACPAMQINT